VQQEFNVRAAKPEDAPKLGTIGPAAYTAAYGYLWESPVFLSEQLETFSTAAFETLLQRADARVWVAEAEGAMVGFLSLVLRSANPITFEENGAEIPRIYLLPGSQGLGLGRMLLGAAVCHARSKGLTHVWLDVMASAKSATHAYSRWGFSKIGQKRFPRPVKANLDEMIVLRKPIDAGA
jgi:ribosomal protein S18 acetylase RimI-like enzyme